MTSLPTLSQIALAAEVSVATVDRVLNGRAGVKPRTRAHVLGVAQRLGHPGPAVALPDMPPAPVRLVFLLPAGTNAFIRALEDQVVAQATALPGVTVAVEVIQGFDPRALSAQLAGLHGRADGVALVAIDHPAVREALRAYLAAGGRAVTLASDIGNVAHSGYIGIDNAQAGRLAGYVMGRFLGKDRRARAALFAGSLAYRGHQEREMGFRQVLTEDFPGFAIADLREVHEDRTRAHAETLALLDRHPDLAGIYNAGGATTGIVRALKERGRDQDVVVIAHEATAANKSRLLDGSLDAVIDQNPRVEVREALATLTHAVRGLPRVLVPPRLQIIFRENLPLD